VSGSPSASFEIAKSLACKVRMLAPRKDKRGACGIQRTDAAHKYVSLASLSQLEMKCMHMLQKFTHIKDYFGVLDPGSRFIMRKRKRGLRTPKKAQALLLCQA
jgi:hypothetical protein